MMIGWLLGWATPENWFAPFAREAFPAAQHVFVPPSPSAVEELTAAQPLDWMVGYSLGSQLLLREATRLRDPSRVALLAPIFAFPREEALGGRCARTQVRLLARWLQRAPAAALEDFYARAGLDIAINTAPTGAALETLAWGLSRLENDRIPSVLPSGWRAWCGEQDALLDASRLTELAPEVRIVPDATHHPAKLLRAFADEVQTENACAGRAAQ